MSAGAPDRAPDRAPDLLHAERLWPSPGAWLMAPLVGVLAAVCLLPVGRPAAVTAGAVGFGLVLAGLLRASARVEVSAAHGLRAGSAVVPAEFLGGGTAARGEAARQLRGPVLDARTHLCLRGWVDGVALVQLDDPADPTPSWLVSSRRPEQLLAAVEAARAASGRPAGG